MLENRPLQRQFNAAHNTGEKHNTQNRPLCYFATLMALACGKAGLMESAGVASFLVIVFEGVSRMLE